MLPINLPLIMFISLTCTIIIEIVIAKIIKIKDKYDLLNIVLVNLLTNPLVVTIPFYVNIRYGLIYRHIILIIMEVLVVIVEGYIYQKYFSYKKINCYKVALVLNVVSFVVGIVINSIIY